MPMHNPCRRCYEDLPISVDVEYVERSRKQLEVRTSYLGAIAALIAGCHGIISADVTNNETENSITILLAML